MILTVILHSKKSFFLCALVLVSAGEATGSTRVVGDVAPGVLGLDAGEL